MPKYGPSAATLALDRRVIGLWQGETCCGGSLEAAAAIAVGEADTAIVGQMVCCEFFGGGKSCVRQIRLLFCNYKTENISK